MILKKYGEFDSDFGNFIFFIPDDPLLKILIFY